MKDSAGPLALTCFVLVVFVLTLLITSQWVAAGAAAAVAAGMELSDQGA